MRKIIFCNVAMREETTPLVYQSETPGLTLCEEAVTYPVLSCLGGYLQPEDSVKIVLLCKCDPQKRYLRNVKTFKAEFQERCGPVRELSYVLVNTEFAECRLATEKLLSDLADQCEPGAEIISDITYGPKTLPIVLLAALSFGIRHLDCKVQHVFYGQVYFQDGAPTAPKLYDLSYLLYLNSLIYTLQCGSPEKAKQTLDMLLQL